MDPLAALEHGIRFGALIKSLEIGGIALILYDYLLMLDEEIQYIWKGRKTFIFYLYVLTRTVLIADRFWNIHVMSDPRTSESGCLPEFRATVVLTTFLLASSDIFIAMRVYAITFRNKFVAAYFGSLVLLRVAISLLSIFLEPVTLLDSPRIPIEALNLCPIVPNLRFKLGPYAIATVFDLSAFLVVAWCAYRNMNTLKFSAVIRTIVAEATMYFLAMVALQMYVQLSFVLMKGIGHEISTAIYTIINPLLTMRFALSLKRSADSGQAQEWKSMQITSAGNFTSSPLSPVHLSVAHDGIEMGPVHSQKGQPQAH